MTKHVNPTETTIAAYDRIAAEYAERWHDAPLDAEIDWFAGYLKPGGLILDVGCGSGRDMAAFAARGFRTVGVDRSAGMLKIAAQKGAGSLVQADARRLPFVAHTFQGV
ncbi:MAG TPA: class I SAM-dependent methyltransferase, partial [Anaerolineae bacterium]|nr:class I SAM-dependent methyltransferase [Anaerolineae bacterium]